MEKRIEEYQIGKEKIYNIYLKITENLKNYETVSEKEMLEEITKVYSDYQNIIEICNYEELEYLKKIISKKFKNQEVDLDLEYELETKLLLVEEESGKKVIPKEYLPSVKKAIKKVKKEEKIELDYLCDLIIGLVKIYGIISPENISIIMSNKINVKEEKILDLVKYNKYLKQYISKVFYDNKEYYYFEYYFYFEEELVYSLDANPELEYADLKIEDLIEHRYNLFDTRKDSIDELLTAINSCHFDDIELVSKILKYATLDYKRDDLKKYISNLKELKAADKKEINQLLEIAMNDMPSATLKGYTPNELMQKNLKEEYDKQYQKTFEHTKNDEAIQDYKILRDEMDSIGYECSMYVTKNYNHRIQEFFNATKENGIEFKMEESNIVNNLILHHSIEDEPSLFSIYVQEGMNVVSKKYKLAWQAEENLIESLFQVKKLNPKRGNVELIDVKNQKNYLIYDLAFSCGSKNLEGSYIYTTLLTINRLTFANGYAFIFLKEFHKDIEKEIKKAKKDISNIKNERTKEFLACYKLFKNENISFSARPLE